ncbi:hypothetical protein CEXT_78551 [Caerostris extrusa]|uniref:Uncharacterized protein n=1 Tax=Caerostris extrusa TaxID=172846 RepID=A0AAV4M9T3_CAEEX|nr:hypothetical protein CEXT_78551 [Caerostris extrusa]
MGDCNNVRCEFGIVGEYNIVRSFGIIGELKIVREEYLKGTRKSTGGEGGDAVAKKRNVSLQEMDDSSAKYEEVFKCTSKLLLFVEGRVKQVCPFGTSKNILEELETHFSEEKEDMLWRRRNVSCRRLMTSAKDAARKFRKCASKLLLFVEGRVKHVCPFGTSAGKVE